jgi:glutamate dehydrogenase/leucine dehydrogenase
LARGIGTVSGRVSVFSRLDVAGHEQVTFCHDRRLGLHAIIAIHSTVLGPAIGGTRFRLYASDDDALEDVLRLSRAMTYKSAVAGLNLGGGKAVVLGDPTTAKSDALLRSYAGFVDRLGGRYLTAEDVGTTQADMDLIREVTPWVTGVSEAQGGSGDPSPATAYGLLHAMRAAALHVWGDAALEGRHVAIAGTGKVGSHLARHLLEAGARLTVADVDRAAVERVVGLDPARVDVASPETVHATACDIYSPCALGSALNDVTIPELRTAAVVGAANNQLADASGAARLAQVGVLYAPDYVVNAGGVINLAEELVGYDRHRAWKRIEGIFDTTTAVFGKADAEHITTAAAADRMAEERLELGPATPQPPS